MPIVICKASDEANAIEERRKKKYEELLRAKLKKKGDNETDRDKIRKLLYSSGSEEELDGKQKHLPQNNIVPTRPEGSAKRRSRRAYLSSNDELKDLLSLKLFHRPHASITQIIKHSNVDNIKTKLVGEDLFYTEEERIECFKELPADSILSTQNKAEKKTVEAASYDAEDEVNSTHDKRDALQKLRYIKDNLNKLSKENKTDFYGRMRESNTRINFIKVGQSLFDKLDDEKRSFDDSLRWAVDHATNNLESLYNYVVNTDTEVQEYEHEKNLTPAQRAKYLLEKKNISNSKSKKGNLGFSTKNMFSKKAETKSNSLHAHNAAQSISQQLDKFANDNKAAFLASVISTGSNWRNNASSPQGRLSLRTASKLAISALPPSNPRGSFRGGRLSVIAVADTEQSNKNVLPVSENETNTAEPGSMKASTTPAVTNDVDGSNKIASVTKDVNAVISVENESGETNLLVKPPPKGTVGTTIAIPTTEANSPQKSPKKPPVPRQALGRKVSKQKEKYTNMMEDNTQAAIEAARKLQAFFRKQLKGTLDQFAHVQKHLEDLSIKSDALTTVCEENGVRIANRAEKFQNRQRDHDSKVTSLCTNATFNWPFSTHAKLESFKIDGANAEKALNQSVTKNMEVMRRDAEHKMKCDKLDNLLNAKWFVTFTTKLKEYLNRSSTVCPKNCFIYLTVLKHLIGLGFTINAKVFYRVIEATLTDKDDHKAVIVHKAVKALREVVNIGAEAFMKYLESKEITPCPELLAQIRANKRKRARKEKLAQQRKAKLSTLNKHLGSSASGIGLSVMEGNLGSRAQLQTVTSSSSLRRRKSKSELSSMSRQGSRVSIISDSDMDALETDGGDASEMGSIWDGSEFEFEDDDF